MSPSPLTQKWTRVGMGSNNTVLQIIAGVPRWTTTLAGITWRSPTITGSVTVDGATGVTATQRTVVRIEENGQDSLKVYYVDQTYVDGILTAISAESSYEIRVDT